MPMCVSLRVRMGQSIDDGRVAFLRVPHAPGNATAQFESEMLRIIEQETERLITVNAGLMAENADLATEVARLKADLESARRFGETMVPNPLLQRREQEWEG